MRRPIDPVVRFWKFVDKFPDGCWRWNGHITRWGYGMFSIMKKPILAHRYSYELHKGNIPSHLQIDHICGNPECVNPDHLEAVTNKTNIIRMYKRRKLTRKGQNNYGILNEGQQR